MVKRLIECEKVEVNLQVKSILLFTTFSKDNDERHTALIAAVNKNFVKVVDALMQHPKLDMNIRYMVDLAKMTFVSRDRYGVSAYQLAKTRGYNGILRLFAKSKLILQVVVVVVLGGGGFVDNGSLH